MTPGLLYSTLPGGGSSPSLRGCVGHHRLRLLSRRDLTNMTRQASSQATSRTQLVAPQLGQCVPGRTDGTTAASRDGPVVPRTTSLGCSTMLPALVRP